MMSTLPPAKRAERIRIATEHGLHNVSAIADASVDSGMSFHLACALLDGESDGWNIYGHDVGGALSTRSHHVTVAGHTYAQGTDIPVTPENAAVFLLMIGAGHKSNGMGPCQITYAADLPDGRSGGYFRQMSDDYGLVPWDVTDNMVFGFSRLFMPLLVKHGSVAAAGAHYNGGTHPNASALDYGARLAARDVLWQRRFGF
jgi:hypothetical protein